MVGFDKTTSNPLSNVAGTNDVMSNAVCGICEDAYICMGDSTTVTKPSDFDETTNYAQLQKSAAIGQRHAKNHAYNAAFIVHPCSFKTLLRAIDNEGRIR